MKYFKFQPEGTKNCSVTAYLQTEVEQENGRRKLPGVVICPGGGYEEVSRREGEPAAKPCFGAGFPQAAIWPRYWERSIMMTNFWKRPKRSGRGLIVKKS